MVAVIDPNFDIFQFIDYNVLPLIQRVRPPEGVYLYDCANLIEHDPSVDRNMVQDRFIRSIIENHRNHNKVHIFIKNTLPRHGPRFNVDFVERVPFIANLRVPFIVINCTPGDETDDKIVIILFIMCMIRGIGVTPITRDNYFQRHGPIHRNSDFFINWVGEGVLAQAELAFSERVRIIVNINEKLIQIASPIAAYGPPKPPEYLKKYLKYKIKYLELLKKSNIKDN